MGTLKSEKTISLKGWINNYSELPLSIYILFVARIINRMGGFVHAFLALFLSTYLGMSPVQIGSYILAAGLAGFIGAYIGGKLSDHFSRKRVYLIAQFIAAVLFIPCGFLTVKGLEYIPSILIASSFFSSVVRPVGNAMVADLVSNEDRKRAFSLLYLGINFGTVLGPIIAAFLLENYLKWFFWGDALTTFLATYLVARYVKEHIITEEEMELVKVTGEKKESGHVLKALLKRPIILVFMVFSMMNSMMYAQSSFAFPLLLQDLYGKSDGLAFYAKLLVLNAIVVLVLTSLIHYATMHLKPIYNIAMASFLYAIGFGMMSIIEAKWLFIVSIVFWTIGEIQSVTNQNVYLISQTPINYRGRFGAVTSIIFSFGYIVSPKIGGIIIDIKGQSYLWEVVFIMGIIATFGYLGIGKFTNRR